MKQETLTSLTDWFLLFDLDETFIEALSLANIKCIAAVILRGMASILSNVHDIFHVQH